MIIFILIIVVIVGIFLYVSQKPDVFRIERAVLINAPKEAIFPLINDFRAWTSWSPYEKMDPALSRKYSGAASGVGAVYEWESTNNKVGKGRMELIESVAPEKVFIKLDFMKPFEGHNQSAFIMKSVGDSTEVTWSTTGPQPFISKIMCLFINMDKLVGDDFATGLANLKAVVEK